METRRDADSGPDKPGPDPAAPLLVELGPTGEICIWYPDHSTYEFWAWTGASDYDEGTLPDAPRFFVPAQGAAAATGDTLLLRSQVRVPGRQVLAMAFLRGSDATYFLSLVATASGHALEARLRGRVETHPVPACLALGLRLKTSSEYACVSSAQGYIYILQPDPAGKALLRQANVDGNLLAVYAHTSRPIIDRDGLHDLPRDSVVFKTSVVGDSPVFDIVGSWLVYSPTKYETDYFKQLVHSNAALPKARDSKTKDAMYTSVKLPPAGPLMLRVVSSLSNSAFDKLFKLSEFSTNKVRGYLSKSDTILDKDVSLHSISTSIGKAMYSTATKLKKLATSSGENEIIKIVDLSNGQIMAMFKPPGGISNLSLSLYDLQLVQASAKGDNFYMWDLYRLPTEVSLVGSFVRGKTGATINDMRWFMNNVNSENIKGSNSGFGCITEKTGTLHWYNVNYLSCGNENKNYPNVFNGVEQDIASGQFMDSWLLPSINAVKFFMLPGSSNVPVTVQGQPQGLKELHKVNQLAFLDTDNNLRLVSPLNGKHTFKYVLPKAPCEQLNVTGKTAQHVWNPVECLQNEAPKMAKEFDTPLSQTEIETCSPYLSMINNKNVELATYAFPEDSDPTEEFLKAFETFDSELPLQVLEFRPPSELCTPLLNSEEDILQKLNEGLVINPDTYGS